MVLLGLALARAATPLASPVDGWSLTVPDGWSTAEQSGAWVMGSPSAPGLVVVSWTPGLGLDALRRQATQQLVDQGLVLHPVGAASERPIGGATAVAADFRGPGPDGAEIGGHAVGVAGPGGGLLVLGLAPAEQHAALAVRVDAVADSVRFSAPMLDDAAGLKGTWCAGTGRLVFDGAGHVRATSPFAEPPPASGPDPALGTYAVSGVELVMRWPDGEEKRCAVRGRRADGRVGDLACGSAIWSSDGCR